MPDSGRVSVAAGLRSASTGSGDAPEHVRSFVQLPTQGRLVDGSGEGWTLLAAAETVSWTGLREDLAAKIVATVMAVLHRFSHQSEIGVDVFRGLCANTAHVSLLVDIDSTDAMTALIERVRTALQTSPTTFEPPGSNVAIELVDAAPTSGESAPAYDFTVRITVGDDALHIGAAYDARQMVSASAERLVRAIASSLRTTLEPVEAFVHTLPLLAPHEARIVTEDLDGPALPEAPALPVERAFRAWAARQPQAVAAEFKGGRWAYGELERASFELARRLVARGVGPGMRVAVCVQPSIDVLVALLAVLRSGGVYLPLDPTHPAALLDMILDEADPAVVLTQSPFRELTHREGTPQILLDAPLPELDDLPSNWPEPQLHDPCYVIYTSGTTGKPKGVVATHGNLLHYIHVAHEKYGFCAKDVFCSLARYTFSISMFELLSPLYAGGRLVLLERDDVLTPERLVRTLARVTVVHAGPSLLGNLFRYLRATPSVPQTFPNLRHASSGGDLVGPHVIEEMKRVFPSAELFVIYGCTEISCMGCTYPIPRDQVVRHSFVGKPFWDVGVRLLDGGGRPCPIGVVGEIHFSGRGITEGYLRRPELTAERFVERDGVRYYQTGDLGRLHPDGNIEILGRQDFQVQIRGIRIELPGIENTIRALELAEQCAVVLQKLGNDDVRLVAFVVHPKDPSPAFFRRTLAEHLPEYMIPQAFVELDALPLTHNGKLDRRRLQDVPIEARNPTGAREEPHSQVERQIAAAFAKILEIPHVALDDDFFALGGHSLSAVMLIHELENALGLSIDPGVLFEHGSVRALACHAQGSFSSEPRPIPLSENLDAPALFMLAGVHLYRDFARELEGHYAVYGVYVGRELVVFEDAQAVPSVVDLARDYLEVIRRAQPHGPYRLAGMSFGGIVAYEAAQQLIAAGEEVEFLGLFDSVLPELGWARRPRELARLLVRPPEVSLRFLAQLVERKLRGQPHRRHAEFVKHDGEAGLASMEDLRQDAYARAAERYVSIARSFPGEVTLITSGRRLDRDPRQSRACGWRRLVERLDVHAIDADHLALVELPAVREVAGVFRRALDRNAKSPSPLRAASR